MRIFLVMLSINYAKISVLYDIQPSFIFNLNGFSGDDTLRAQTSQESTYLTY